MDRGHLLERPNPYGTVRTTGNEGVTAHLKLTNKGSVALKNSLALPAESSVQSHIIY
jgi:hypothetical protein